MKFHNRYKLFSTVCNLHQIFYYWKWCNKQANDWAENEKTKEKGGQEKKRETFYFFFFSILCMYRTREAELSCIVCVIICTAIGSACIWFQVIKFLSLLKVKQNTMKNVLRNSIVDSICCVYCQQNTKQKRKDEGKRKY